MCPDVRRTRRRSVKRHKASGSLSSRLSAQQHARLDEPVTARTLMSGWALNPYLAFLLLVGVGVATLRLEHVLRLVGLWTVLLTVTLLYAESGHLKGDYSLMNLARGGLTGIVVALPFYLFAKDFFYATASYLYGVDDILVLLERAVFLVPILEECFFRGVVQYERGLLDGALLFGLAQLLYFVPFVSTFPLIVIAIALGAILLGLLCGHLYRRYGLTASISCHVAVNLVLLVLPPLVERVGAFLW